MKGEFHLNKLKQRTETVLISLYNNASNETGQALRLHLIEIDDAALLASIEEPGVSQYFLHLYASLDGDSLAGRGALFVDNNIAWPDWSATAPHGRN